MPPIGAEPPEPDDVTRRTHLANERTYLAWWRTALAALALAIGVGRVLPEVAGGTDWPYVAVGVGWGVAGIVMAAYAMVRLREVDRALARRGYAHPSPAVIALFTALAVVLGIATVALVLVAP